MGTFADLEARGVDKLQILGYGKPGKGKTVQFHSWPRVRTLDLDNGLRSVLEAVKKGLIPEPEGWEYETIVETELGKHGFIKRATAFDRATDTIDRWLEDSGSWDTLIVDSITNLNVYAINKALENMDKLGLSKSWNQSKSVQMQIVKMQDYGGAMTLFVHFMDWIRSLDKNIICIAHEYEQTDDEGQVRSVMPLLIGQLRQRIVKDFDEVWYCTTRGTRDTTRFVTQTKSDGLVTAKSRLGVFEAQEDFLTYQRVLEKLSPKRKGGKP